MSRRVTLTSRDGRQVSGRFFAVAALSPMREAQILASYPPSGRSPYLRVPGSWLESRRGRRCLAPEYLVIVDGHGRLWAKAVDGRYRAPLPPDPLSATA